jgi:hypothetical protein
MVLNNRCHQSGSHAAGLSLLPNERERSDVLADEASRTASSDRSFGCRRSTPHGEVN